MNVKQLKDKEGNDIQPNSPDKVGYPNPSGTQLTWGIVQPITEDGWIDIGGSTDGTDAKRINLWVNGSNPVRFQGDATVGFTVPVKKGDSVNTSGGTGGQKIWFHPNRTNLENGGGGSLTP